MKKSKVVFVKYIVGFIAIFIASMSFANQSFVSEFKPEIKKIDTLKGTPEIYVFNEKKELVMHEEALTDNFEKDFNSVVDDNRKIYVPKRKEDREKDARVSTDHVLRLMKKDMDSRPEMPEQAKAPILQDFDRKYFQAFSAPPKTLDEILDGLLQKDEQLILEVKKAEKIIVVMYDAGCSPCDKLNTIISEKLKSFPRNLVLLKIKRH